MVKCPQCGTKNSDSSRYCEDCGATLKFDRPVQQFDRDDDDGTVVLIDHESGGVEVPVIRPSRVNINSGSSAYSQRGMQAPRPAPAGNSNPVLAIVSLVLSILSIGLCMGMTSFVSFGIALFALLKFRNDDGSINKIALAAVIVSAAGMGFAMLWILVSISKGN